MTGRDFDLCLDMAIEKCSPMRTIVDKIVEDEFPVSTFADQKINKKKK